MHERAYCHRRHVDGAILTNTPRHPSWNGASVGICHDPNDNEFYISLGRRPGHRVAFHIDDDGTKLGGETFFFFGGCDGGVTAKNITTMNIF